MKSDHDIVEKIDSYSLEVNSLTKNKSVDACYHFVTGIQRLEFKFQTKLIAFYFALEKSIHPAIGK